MPLIEIAKPDDYKIGEGHADHVHFLAAISRLPAKALAIVLQGTDGCYHTYQFGCDAAVMFDCATALTEYFQIMQKAEGA